MTESTEQGLDPVRLKFHFVELKELCIHYRGFNIICGVPIFENLLVKIEMEILN